MSLSLFLFIFLQGQNKMIQWPDMPSFREKACNGEMIKGLGPMLTPTATPPCLNHSASTLGSPHTFIRSLKWVPKIGSCHSGFFLPSLISLAQPC